MIAFCVGSLMSAFLSHRNTKQPSPNARKTASAALIQKKARHLAQTPLLTDNRQSPSIRCLIITLTSTPSVQQSAAQRKLRFNVSRPRFGKVQELLGLPSNPPLRVVV